MRLQVKGRQRRGQRVDSAGTRRRSSRKLDKQLAEPTQVELELAVEQNPSIAANHVAEATIWTKGPTLRAREASCSYEASIDQLVDKLERQVKRYREKRSRRERTSRRRHAPGSTSLDFTAEQLEQMIVKSKQFDLQPMSPKRPRSSSSSLATTSSSSATRTTGKTNVVYRRRDGGYGLIEPRSSEPLLAAQGAAARAACPRGRARRAPRRTTPAHSWGEVGIHGVHRQRVWDAVATVDVPDARRCRDAVRRARGRHAGRRDGGSRSRAARGRARGHHPSRTLLQSLTAAVTS